VLFGDIRTAVPIDINFIHSLMALPGKLAHFDTFQNGWAVQNDTAYFGSERAAMAEVPKLTISKIFKIFLSSPFIFFLLFFTTRTCLKSHLHGQYLVAKTQATSIVTALAYAHREYKETIQLVLSPIS
jgi:hypothetical protein